MKNHLDHVISTIKTDSVDNLVSLSKNVHILWSESVNFQPQAHEIGNYYKRSNQIDELSWELKLYPLYNLVLCIQIPRTSLMCYFIPKNDFWYRIKRVKVLFRKQRSGGNNGSFMAARGQKIRQSPYLHVHLYHLLGQLISFYSKYVITNNIDREGKIAERRRI